MEGKMDLSARRQVTNKLRDAGAASPSRRTCAGRRSPRRCCPLHVIVYDCVAHHHPDVHTWLEKDPASTCTSPRNRDSGRASSKCSFLQRWALKRITFTSVKDLFAAITRFLDGWKERCEPFTWTKTPDEILAKAIRK